MGWPFLWVMSAAAQGPVDVWVTAPRHVLDRPGVGFAEGSAVGADGARWRVLATEDALQSLSEDGYTWTLAPPPPPDLPAGYRSPDAMVQALNTLAMDHPTLTTLTELGHSALGRPILGLRISATDHPRAQWRILGAHHGDELPSGEVVIDFAQTLLEGFGGDPDLTAFLERDAVWVVPHVNPDGVAAMSRQNADGVDLNRNYDYEWSVDALGSGDVPFSEPESRAIRALTDWNPFVAGLSYHSGATNIGWAWNWTDDDSRDDELLEAMADRYAERCQTDGFWSTNGAAWYPTRGDTNDWSFGRYGILDFTVELTLTKAPSFDRSLAVVEEHRDAMVDFLLHHPIVSGQVVDAATGQGIGARLDPGALGEPSWTGPRGDFARISPLSEDTPLTLTVNAPGYTSADIAVTPGVPITVALLPDETPRLSTDSILLSQGGDGTFFLQAPRVTLTRPGNPAVVATSLGEGRWQVDPQAMAPGAWDMVTSDGIAPRSVFIGEVDDRIRIDAVSLQGDTLTLTGQHFGPGLQADAIVGDRRGRIALPILDRAHRSVQLDVRMLRAEPTPVDLLLWTGGYQLSVLDVFGEGLVDVSAPLDNELTDSLFPSDTPYQHPESVIRSGCGVTGHRGGAGLLPFALLLVTTRRRR
ncbi:MAG: M14 family zinc carboxypeptidase [Myxococcota bacterium]